MVDRRDLISGAVLAGLAPGTLSAAAAPSSSPAPAGDEAAELQGLRQEVRELRIALASVSTDVEAIRAQQRLFLRSTGRYPDFIDVGLDAWERMYDWHVRWRQPIAIIRLPDGLYGMTYMTTTIVLKANMQANYIGPGYEAK